MGSGRNPTCRGGVLGGPGRREMGRERELQKRLDEISDLWARADAHGDRHGLGGKR